MKDPCTVLQSIPGFSGAQLISQLSAGPTNNSYEVEQGSERFVLRIDKTEAASLGLDRRAERDVCELLASEGLGHVPLWFDTDAGIYLRRFLPGKTWTRQDLLSVQKLARLARLLRRLHNLPLAGKPFEPLLAASAYTKQLGTVEAAQVFAELADRHAEIENAPRALCHNDLVCGNILEDRDLMLIDWEYAGTGDPFFDLAVVVQHHDLGLNLARHFLDAYLGRVAVETEVSRLVAQCRFYQTLLILWNLRTESCQA